MNEGAFYPVIHVSAHARVGDEPMGTKRKFWWEDASGQRWLFKYARPNTGEHWAEKIAAEVGALLRVPCATVELAECEGAPGCLVRSFLPERSAALVHGNELLQLADTTYPTTQLRGVSKHTVTAVLEALADVEPPTSVATHELPSAHDWMVGYLLLDAIIANGDRHHENWGVLQLSRGTEKVKRLAPSYDHASSLGRELSDGERQARITGRDRRRTVATYLRRARSAFYLDESSSKSAHPLHAFRAAAATRPRAEEVWLARLSDMSDAQLEGIIHRVPDQVMTELTRTFALELLRCTRKLILASEEAPR